MTREYQIKLVKIWSLKLLWFSFVQSPFEMSSLVNEVKDELGYLFQLGTLTVGVLRADNEDVSSYK